MSGSEPSPHDAASVHVVDVLLAFDTAALLANHPEASLHVDTPTVASAERCYLLASGLDGLTARNDGGLRIVAPIGAHLHLRPSTLAMRSEHLVLMSGFHPADARALSEARLVVRDDVELTVPSPDDTSMFARRLSMDYYWEILVRAHGSVDAQLDVIVTDRAGETLGCFRWALVVEIVAP